MGVWTGAQRSHSLSPTTVKWAPVERQHSAADSGGTRDPSAPGERGAFALREEPLPEGTRQTFRRLAESAGSVMGAGRAQSPCE